MLIKLTGKGRTCHSKKGIAIRRPPIAHTPAWNLHARGHSRIDNPTLYLPLLLLLIQSEYSITRLLCLQLVWLIDAIDGSFKGTQTERTAP